MRTRMVGGSRSGTTVVSCLLRLFPRLFAVNEARRKPRELGLEANIIFIHLENFLLSIRRKIVWAISNILFPIGKNSLLMKQRNILKNISTSDFFKLSS